MIASRFLLAAALAFVVGCGNTWRHPDATIWITRDRGAQVLKTADGHSGATAAQALEGVAKVKTRYGGAFIQGIDGLQGGGQHDWFIYVNGYALAESATDYVLHPGDVEWWDYRRWDDPAADPLVVGAFPEPFLHGLHGKVRPAAVRYVRTADVAAARRLGRILHARSVARSCVAVPRGWNELLLADGAPRFQIRYRDGHGDPGDAVLVTFSGQPSLLASDPRRYAFTYQTP